jgi:hypothetical protein
MHELEFEKGEELGIGRRVRICRTSDVYDISHGLLNHERTQWTNWDRRRSTESTPKAYVLSRPVCVW